MTDCKNDELSRLRAMQLSLREEYMPTKDSVQKPTPRWHQSGTRSTHPPLGYICHTCQKGGHWRHDCTVKTAARAAQSKYTVVDTCDEIETAGSRNKMLYWRLRFEMENVRHPIPFTGLYIPMGVARNAIAMSISGVKNAAAAEKSRSWKEFTYGNVSIRIFKDAELTVEYTDPEEMIRANTLVHCKRVPMKKREREDTEERGRAHQRPTWATEAVTAEPGALEREFAWIAAGREAPRPLALEGPQ